MKITLLMFTNIFLYKISAAKVRRLYDIANVFASMNLIEKVMHVSLFDQLNGVASFF